MHVQARRYLVSVGQSYCSQLSWTSRASLEQQGRPMRDSRLRILENQDDLADPIHLRKLDDPGKQPDLSVEEPDYWLDA